MADKVFFLNSECITLPVQLGPNAYYEGGPERPFEIGERFKYSLMVLNSIV